MISFVLIFSGVEVQCVLYDRCAARAFREKPDNPTLPVSVVIAFARISFNENGLTPAYLPARLRSVYACIYYRIKYSLFINPTYFYDLGYPQLSSSYNATRVSYDPPLPEVVELTKKCVLSLIDVAAGLIYFATFLRFGIVFVIFRAIAIGFGPPQLLTDCVLDSGSSSSSPVHTRNRFRVALDDIVNQEMVSLAFHLVGHAPFYMQA